MEYNISEIKEIIPHRYPFLLIDKVVDGEVGSWAKAVKNVTANEEFFNGHFPNHPVMPGVLIIEALAQTGAVAILSEEENKGKIAFFGGIKEAKFKRQVVPGDTLELECHLTRKIGSIGFGKATAKADGKLVCSAELTFVING